MGIYCPRRYYQIIKYSVTCIIMSILLIFSISFKIQNQSLSYLNLSQIYDDKNFLITNESFASSITYQIEITKSYPYLPIQIYTKNREKFLKLKPKTKKLILLANSFFSDPTWAMKSIKNQTNSGNMSELYCSFLNNYCEITNDIKRFKQADAVVIHLIDYFNRSNEILKYRHASQRFVSALWEPPVNSRDLRSYKNYFNWTMTYRFDSHIFASYYLDDSYRLKTKNIQSDYRSNEEKFILYENINIIQKKGTVAALISNCGKEAQNRLLIIAELQKYIDVTVYGKCGRSCPKSILNQTIDCRTYISEHYYFILAFENSYCQDYTTEKFFSAIALPIIPVVFGQPDYTRYIPQSGFIDIRQFSSLSELANRLKQIRNNLTLYQEYFYWKKQFTWGGFSTFMTPLCDLCLRLHLDKTPNIIDDINKWWYHKTCHPEVKKYI